MIRKKSKPKISNQIKLDKEKIILNYLIDYPTHGPRRIANELKQQGNKISEPGIYNVLRRRKLNHRLDRLFYAQDKSDNPVIEQKKSYLFKVSEKALHRSRLITKMGTSEYQELAKKRAGIEGIPSVLRRRYKIDHLPVRGEVRVKVWLGFKISAINCKRLIKGLMNRPIPGLSILLYNNLLSLFSFQRTYRIKFAA